MSILCQRAERAVCKALIHLGSDDLEGIDLFDAFVGNEDTAIANVLEQAVEGEYSFTLSFYTGETTATISTPAIIVTSNNATEDQDAAGNALVDVQVDVMFPAESDPDENVIKQLEAASVWVWQVLHRSDLAELVSNEHDSLTVCGVDPAGFDGGRITEGRQRIHRYRVRLYCAGKTLVVE